MKKIVLPVTAALLSWSAIAWGAEFQPIGALGMGGAGVARMTDANAAYWNPAGLAFSEKTFTMKVEGSAGYRLSDGLAQNIDSLSKFTQKGPDGNSTFDDLKTIGSSSNPAVLGDVVSLLSVLQDIQDRKGRATLEANAAVTMQVKHVAFGAFASTESYGNPDIDLQNILPSSTSGSATPADIASFAGAAAGAPPSNSFFTDPTVRNNITTALVGAGFTNAQATDIVNSVDARLSAGSTGGNIPTVTQQQAANVLINTIAPAFKNGGTTSSINNNRSAMVMKSILYTEFPLAYGHPIDLGRFGKLGIGGSLKVINGRVYRTQLDLVENGSSVNSGNLADNLLKNYKETNNVTFDLGAFYKYGDWLNLGVVGKNLTSPSFAAPELKDQHGNVVTRDAAGNPIRNDKVTIKPQVRAGIALNPLSWLTMAADIDITNNEPAVFSGDGYRSRNLGGGIELHPVSWFKVRGGMYKNLSNDEVGPVATAGITFGTTWVNLDVDGAYGLKSAKYKGDNLPTEARVESSLNLEF